MQSVKHRRRHDDRGAVLVVVKDRDFHPLLQLRFDLEALGRLDVLKIDAAEGRLQRRHHFDDALDLVGGDLDVEHVDAGEFLEQDRLAFHHRLGGERPDIAEAEHGGAVRHDADEIRARGKLSRRRRVGRDRLAGRRDAGRIGEREIALVAERFGRLDFEFSRPRRAVVDERPRPQVVGNR